MRFVKNPFVVISEVVDMPVRYTDEVISVDVFANLLISYLKLKSKVCDV